MYGINLFRALLKNTVREKRGKIVIYTAVFGGKDDINELPKKCEGTDYIFFTDNKYLSSQNFEIIVREPTDPDSARSAKIYKIMPHVYLPGYDYTIWIDGSVLLKEKFCEFIDRCVSSGCDMAFFKHPERDCVYDEAEACIKLKKDDENVIRKQISIYREQKYPERDGLVSGGVIFRKNKSEAVKDINEKWWKEIKQHSRRDQLSFNYIAWRNNFRYVIFNDNLWDNQYFKILKHNK